MMLAMLTAGVRPLPDHSSIEATEMMGSHTQSTVDAGKTLAKGGRVTSRGPLPPRTAFVAVVAMTSAIVLAMAFAPAPAYANPRPDGMDIKLFRPGPGASDYLHLSGGFLLPPIGLSVNAIYDAANAPLVETRNGFDPTRAIVSQQSHLNVGAALSLTKWFEVGLSLPIAISQGAGAAFADAAPGRATPGFALGDLRLIPKAVLYNDSNTFALAIGAELVLPTGSSFSGYGALAGGPQLIIDFQPAYYVRLTMNAGARFREDTTFSDLRMGNAFTWGAGLQLNFRVADQLFSILGSLAGEIPFSYNNKDNNPFEFLAGLGWRGVENLNIFAAMGAGLNRGYGAPDVRMVAGVRWGDFRECLDGPEDFDGWQDQDGCAELDNDLDGIPDPIDTCPNVAETRNGWEDLDGCPDVRPIGLVDLAALDASASESGAGGGVASANDTRDSDRDGVPDNQDACPMEAEDMDGFQDLDGCPEPDNDGDGVVDAKDLCPLQAETINDYNDHDGCPDEVPANVKVRVSERSRSLIIGDLIYFVSGTSRIDKRSDDLLQAIADILVARPDITRVGVEGHTDNVGKAAFNLKLSADRAESVKAWFVENGIAASRVETRGAGQAEPIADNHTSAGRAQNRRVEFKILRYEDDK